VTTLAAYQDTLKLTQTSLVESYAPLVKRIAYHLIVRFPQSVQVDDLIQAGMMGLLQAASNYDETRGASFSTYASIRVRGAMIDELRRCDWAPRSVLQHSRKLSQAQHELANKYGRQAKNHEVAAHLGVSLAEHQKMLVECRRAQVCALDDIASSEDRFTCSLTLAGEGPLEAVTREEFQRALQASIAELPEREQILLSLYYNEELNLREIGLVLGISESRVCQLHAQAVKRLNQHIQSWILATEGD
jgi:RNA polymerase sigma factor FliA